MDGHQGHAVVFPFIGVDIIYESNFFKEFCKSAFRLLGDEVFRDRKQLAQIFLTALRLRILALLQLREILRICHDLLNQLEHIHFRGCIQKIKIIAEKFVSLRCVAEESPLPSMPMMPSNIDMPLAFA